MATTAIDYNKVHNEKTITCTTSIFNKYSKLRSLTKQGEAIEAAIKSIKDDVKKFMGIHGVLVDARDVRLVTWTVQHEQRFDIERFKLEHADLYEQYKTACTKRVFRLK